MTPDPFDDDSPLETDILLLSDQADISGNWLSEEYLEAELCLVKPKTSGVIYLPTNDRNFDRLVRLTDGTFDALSTFWRDSEPFSLTVIARAEKIPHLEDMLVRVPNVSLGFLSLEALMPSRVDAVERPEHAVRELVHLAYAARGPHDFAICLRPGCFAARFLNQDALAPSGRGLTDWEVPDIEDPRWKEASSLLPTANIPAWGLTAASCIYGREIAADALAAIQEVEGRGAPPSNWDASSIYTLAGHERLEKLHQIPGSLGPNPDLAIHGPANLIDVDNIGIWNPRAIVRKWPHPAFVALPNEVSYDVELALSRLYHILPY